MMGRLRAQGVTPTAAAHKVFASRIGMEARRAGGTIVRHRSPIDQATVPPQRPPGAETPAGKQPDKSKGTTG